MTAVVHIWSNCIYMQPDTMVNHQVRYYFKQGFWQQGHNRITRQLEHSWVVDFHDNWLKIQHFNELIVFELRLIEDDSRPNYKGVGVERVDRGVPFQVRVHDILG